MSHIQVAPLAKKIKIIHLDKYDIVPPERIHVDMRFSNSLIIHQVKTKEIMTVTVVWIPDLN